MEHADFLLASGSVIGRDHRRLFTNYQDGRLIVRVPECTLAVVTDGCGSSPHSEVGAQLGAHFLAEAVLDGVRRGVGLQAQPAHVLHSTMGRTRDLVSQMYGDHRRLIEDYFLFTIVGVLLWCQEATFFALGDGVIVVNGEVVTLGPFPNNRPPYAGYGLLDSRELELQVVQTCSLASLKHFLVGTDGVADLIDAQDKQLPGLDTPVGAIAQFWEDSRYFSGNPDLVSRRLRLIGRDWPKRQPQPGLLHDDTTLVVGRRIQSNQEEL